MNIVESSKGQSAGKVQLCRQKIKSLRQLNGFSQEGLSHALYDANCQVSIATVKRIETGKPVSFRIAGQMAKFFGASVDELIARPSEEDLAPRALPKSVWLYVIFAPPRVHDLSEQDIGAWLKVTGLTVMDKVGGYYIGYDADSQTLERLQQLSRHQRLPPGGGPVKVAIKKSDLVMGPDHGDPIKKRDLDELVSLVQLLGPWSWVVDDASMVALSQCYVIERMSAQIATGYWLLHLGADLTTQLVGRQAEWQQMTQVLRGENPTRQPVQCVHIQGDRGVGKSHLMHAVGEHVIAALSGRRITVMAREQVDSLSVLAKLLLSALALPGWASTSERSDAAQRIGLSTNETERLLVLLDAKAMPRTERLALRVATTDAKLVRQVLSQTQVRVLVLDDAECVDGDSWQVIQRAMEQMSVPPRCLIASDRPLPWGFSDRWHIQVHTLSPLTREDTTCLAQRWAPSALSDVVLAQCVDICGGNPAFLRQLILEAPFEAEPLAPSYSFVDQQVERLTVEQKRVLWAAVACGPSVDSDVIRATFSYGDAALAILCQSSLLRRVESKRYTFLHSTVHAYLKDRITSPVWIDINTHLTQALAPRLDHGGTPAEWPLLYAHCLAQQGQPAKAFERYMEIARGHKDQGELHQAITTLQWAESSLQLAYSLRREINWLLLLGTVYKSHYGWSSPQQKRVFDQLQRVCVKSAQQGGLGSVFFHQWLEKLMALELDEALRLASVIQQHGVTMVDSCIQVHGWAAQANTHFWAGDLDAAIVCAQQALDLHQVQDHSRDLREFGQDPRVVATLFLVLSYSLRGEAPMARRHLVAMTDLVASSNNVFSEAIGAQAALFYYFHAEQAEEVESRAEALLALAQRFEMPFFIGIAKVFLGWSLGRQGQGELGLALLADGYHHWLAKSGHRMGHSLYCCMSAELMLSSEQPHRARTVLQSGLHFMRSHGELTYLDRAERLMAWVRGALNID